MAQRDDLLQQNLRKVFNLKHFVNNKQKDAVNAILKRDRDVIVSMPSGCRKSLCYQIPSIMETNKITIVCSSSSASIRTHIHYLKKYKLSATSIKSILSDDDRDRITTDALAENPAVQFIYVTPEQASADNFMKILQSLNEKDKLAYFAVHDAHYVSQRVQDFRQEYRKFGSLRKAYPSVPWIALTQNACVDVLADITENLQLREPIATFKKSSFRKNLFYDLFFKNTLLYPFTHLAKHVMSFLENVDDGTGHNSKKPSGIIYCKNRETVDLVTGKLSEAGISVKAHHGGMRTKDCKKVIDDWMANMFPVIVVTNSFGACHDKSSIRFAVHWDVPRSVVNYYKESGMAGRDGMVSYSRIYYCKEDVMAINATLKGDIAKAKDANGSRKALRAHADFLKMTSICETVACRHKMFSDYFQDVAPDCKVKCDVCSKPKEVQVALDIFYRLSGAPSQDIDDTTERLTFVTTTINGELIKLEHPNSSNQQTTLKSHPPPRSGSPAHTIIKEENVNDDLFGKETQPPSPARTELKEEFNDSRCVSPAETVIDEKPVLNTGIDHVTLPSDELFGMQTQPSGNVSPARTIVKEECNFEPNGTDPSVIEEKHDVNTPVSGHVTDISASPITPNSIRAAHVTTEQHSLQTIVIKNEPKSPERPVVDSSESIISWKPIAPSGGISRNGTNSANGTRTDISPFITIVKQESSNEQPTSRCTSPTGTIVKDECLSPEGIEEVGGISGNGTDSANGARNDISSFVTIVKQEPSNEQPVSRSTSPTGTILKDECLSPERIQEVENDCPDPNHHDGKGSERAKKNNRKFDDVTPLSAETISLRKVSKPEQTQISDAVRDPSTEPEFVSTFRGKSRGSKVSRRRSHNRSRSNERLKRERRTSRSRSISRGRTRSRSKERLRRERKVTRRSRRRSPYRRRSHSRRRSNERFKKSRSRSNERETDGELSTSSSYSKTSYQSYRSERVRKRRRHRYSSESQTDASYGTHSNDRYSRSTQRPSTSTNNNVNSDRVQFSVSPPVEKKKRENEGDDKEPDYGWEDPAPSKLEAKPKSTLEDLDANVNEKMKQFHIINENASDLSLVEASKEELFKSIEEAMAMKANAKLSELDQQIEKKRNDYCHRLFGTDNFDSWDDDPALGNTKTTEKLKPFKSHVPNDVPLHEKMSMKHVINAMRIAPVRNGNELVFHGLIKQIENEFRGQEMPRHLIESMKVEKGIIADLVKKHLMPYYDAGRIQPRTLFVPTARRISHIFYNRFADENIIKRYIDKLFSKVGAVTASSDVIIH